MTPAEFAALVKSCLATEAAALDAEGSPTRRAEAAGLDRAAGIVDEVLVGVHAES